MKFADFISVKAIKPELESKDKEAVIRELVASLVASGEIMEDSAESIIKAIMKREELGSTGIGRGIAVPHTKHPSVLRRPVHPLLLGVLLATHSDELADFEARACWQGWQRIDM